MSCLRYRKIKNPLDPSRKGFYDKSYISIPDCRCSKCRKSKQNDWLVRSYFEYTSKPTSAFFVTLDFADEYLPKYGDIPCFDSKLMTDFFETLRKCSNLPNFRYLYSSDYGGFLERPHYHVVFLFDKGSVSMEDFMSVITFYWKYGYHENIQQLSPSYAGNPFKCFEYVCKYTTKELSFELRTREAKLPKRYRSLTSASVGYGAQCMDSSEFKSDRLIRDGVIFNDVPTITRKYLLENSVLYLDIKNNGVLVPFSIPRYYELKLMYDYHYDRYEKKVSLRKNTYGSELSEIRHNCHYIQVYSDFVNSRDYNIMDYSLISNLFNDVFPDSPYHGFSWSDIVDDVLLSADDFYDCCRFYDYLNFYNIKDTFISVPKIYDYDTLHIGTCNDVSDVFDLPHSKFLVHSLGCYGVHRKVVDYYKYDVCVQALWIFRTWKSLVSMRNAHFDDWEQRENQKARLRAELKRNPYKKYYLRRKNFNFSKLNFKAYVPFNFTKKD